MSKEKKLKSLCDKFIREQKITCGECIWQSDRVIENAYDLIEGICDILGYYNEVRDKLESKGKR
jgi:hypothetical protein